MFQLLGITKTRLFFDLGELKAATHVTFKAIGKPIKVREPREFYESDQNDMVTDAFFRCQMSDDFSERGHMVNFIFGS